MEIVSHLLSETPSEIPGGLAAGIQAGQAWISFAVSLWDLPALPSPFPGASFLGSVLVFL